MALNPITNALAAWHLRRAEHPQRSQRATLRSVLESSAEGAVGRSLHLDPRMAVKEYLQVPGMNHAFFDPHVRAVLDGDAYRFGRRPIVALAETSGSTGTPKLIPHTERSLDAIVSLSRLVMLVQLRESVFALPQFTKWMLVTASSQVRREGAMDVGFVSGLIYQRARGARGRLVLPTPDVASIGDWGARVRAAAAEAVHHNVGALFGVPAYVVGFLEEAKRAAGHRNLAECWPLLDRLYYSGTRAEGSRARVADLVGRELEERSLYLASEGSFGAELDPGAGGQMRFLPDSAFFAFREVAEGQGAMRPLEELEPGRLYEVFVTTWSGLLQYEIGDVIEVTSQSPLLFRIVGRKGESLNLATEKLTARQTELAMAGVSSRNAVSPDRFAVLPSAGPGLRHRWIIERMGPAVDSGQVAKAVDEELSRINPSYAALRAGGAVLGAPQAVLVPAGSFDAYINAGVARRGQFKFRHLHTSVDSFLGLEGIEPLRPYLEG